MMRNPGMLLLTISVVSCWINYVAPQKGLFVDIFNDGNYRLLVNGAPWLTSGDTFFNSDGTKYSLADKTLKLINVTSSNGQDGTGQWQSTTFNYQAGALSTAATIKYYINPQLPLAIFTQTYVTTATRTSAPTSDHVISSFPSFRAETDKTVELGFLSYGGYVTGYSSLRMGRWGPQASFTTGMQGGPLVIFDNATNALVISPMSQFMAASDQLNSSTQVLHYGIMGLVDTVPSNYSMDFIIYYSNKGINQAMSGWGLFLRELYGKQQFYRTFMDTTVNYLGYWTDNGAYYYYNTEKDKNYEATIIDLVTYINNTKTPFTYTQYDSWWYQKGHAQGVLSWTPMNEIIPDGFQYLYNQTQRPFGCHNRFWDNQTLYAKYNGGKYNFISDQNSGLAVPDDEQFWLDLFNMTLHWGPFILYEQDWLNVETDKNTILQTDLDIGRRWLVGMGKGAEAYTTICIQYCLAYSRHILQSLEIPAVTQARVSRDYSPGGKQWDIGITSMLADAVGLAPFKDTFWTTEVQPGSPYGDKTENKTRLNCVLATLSTGPVGPGDGIGYVNKTLLMRCCDSQGQILQPSKPATAVDDQMKIQAFPTYTGPQGQVYTTYSNISGYIFGIVLAAQLDNEYSMKPSAGWTFGELATSVLYSGTEPWTAPVPFSESLPLKLGRECTDVNFCLYYTSPVIQLTSGSTVILLGEPDKWVPMSFKRFYLLQQTKDDILLVLVVNEFETVTFKFIVDFGPIQTIICDNSKSSKPSYVSQISIASKTCSL